MKKLASGVIAGAAAFALGGAVLHPAQAVPTDDGPAPRASVHAQQDNRPGPKTREVKRQKAKARAMLANGSATLQRQPGGGAVVEIAEGEYVEFPVDRTDKVLTMLGEFGTAGSGRYGRTPGPLHNEIAPPDREVDNSTHWVEDFSQAHYDEMFNGDGESFRDYYRQVSSGRYDVSVTTEDWVTVPGNASSYGDNKIEDNGGSWAFIADTANAWYEAQLAAGSTATEIDAYLAQFDVWDRYDFDSDGEFNEADGYIDHFQAVHAGEGEEAGADADAIWSHRWYAYGNRYGQSGPTLDGGTTNLYGGTQIGGSKYFIGDYTVEPENGGLGVFAHEYGHDLELPDYYDTAGGENGTGFWTLMSSGSWLGHGDPDIGTTPGLMGPEEKLFLGWLDHTEVDAGESGEFTLSPSQYTMNGMDQAVKVNLPDRTTTRAYTTAPEGDHAWYSGRADNLVSTLTRPVAAAARVSIKADVWHQIEAGYDYLYAEYSLDGGTTWTALAALDGTSDWRTRRWAYRPKGAASLFRFRYATDGGVNEAGAFIDNIVIDDGTTTFTDGAEAGDNGWDVDGFTASSGTVVKTTPRYYLIENRQYAGYDSTLETGPYQFSEGFTRPNWVEHFPYQDGMLVWLVDLAFADNNTIDHEGEGYALPVDARPDSLTYPDGTSPSNRREPFDATFGLSPTDEVCLHKQVSSTETLAACAPSVAGIATFDDSDPEAYWTSTNPLNSVKVAGVGVTATVTAENADGSITVAVQNPAAP